MTNPSIYRLLSGETAFQCFQYRTACRQRSLVQGRSTGSHQSKAQLLPWQCCCYNSLPVISALLLKESQQTPDEGWRDAFNSRWPGCRACATALGHADADPRWKMITADGYAWVKQPRRAPKPQPNITHIQRGNMGGSPWLESYRAKEPSPGG